MSSPLPEVIQHLLNASSPAEREDAWAAFLEAYSALVLHAVRRMDRDSDTVMDRYAFILDALRRDEYRRLRQFAESGRGKFTTWLVAVVRRLCVDQYRARYGRSRPTGGGWRDERRALVDSISGDVAIDSLEGFELRPDEAATRNELRRALDDALSRLDVSERLILRLRFQDEVTVPEIARLMGYGSPFELYREIDKLLKTLRCELEAVGIRQADS